ncbi:hypothetical protein V6N13_026903 [Hibiscus sabdariffa]|uniref:Uncharacterized protein n=2 Tax=Hibiscus sabdariffa TaxID=183260 RepID=A0ABR2N7U6_9ROSI
MGFRVLVGVPSGIFTGFIFPVMFNLVIETVRGSRKNSGTSIYSQLIKEVEDLAFLEKDDGFDSLQIIGKGGCGEVYKAGLHSHLEMHKALNIRRDQVRIE